LFISIIEGLAKEYMRFLLFFLFYVLYTNCFGQHKLIPNVQPPSQAGKQVSYAKKMQPLKAAVSPPSTFSTASSSPKEKPLVRCYTTQNEALRRLENPELENREAFEEWLAKSIESRKKGHNHRQASPLIQIPVIVHVVHNGEPIGEGANITAAQVYSQLEVLTEDFRRKNSDASNTPAEFIAFAADIEVEFVPATIGPSGKRLPEPGIRRYNGNRPSWNTRGDIEDILKPATIWSPTDYCNMWTLALGGEMSNILGYAQFPEGSGLPGMPGGTKSAETDGVVMGYPYFGSKDKDPNGSTFTLKAPFDLGRTTSHELGHWLGLRHIWGDGDCSVDDYVSDTPESDAANYGCDAGHVSCSTTDMVQNYMDYSNDACMNIFTLGQKDRVRTVMNNSPRRVELQQSTVAGTGTSNDAGISFFKEFTSCGGSLAIDALLTNFSSSSTLLETLIHIEINGEVVASSPFLGIIDPLKSQYVTLSPVNISAGLHNIRVYTSLPNGVSDENPQNDAFNKEVNYSIVSGNFSESFESEAAPDFQLSANSHSAIGFAADAANSSQFGLFLEGKGSEGYPADGTGPSEAEAFEPSHTHYAAARLCYDATYASSLQLSFDYYLNFGLDNDYTNFRYRVLSEAGTYSSGVIKPNGADKPWTHVMLDLSSHAGSVVQIIFESNCKYPHNSTLGGVSGAGNGVYLENVALTYTTSVPEISFVSTSSLVQESKATTSSGCRTYTDKIINLKIANAPSQDASVLVSVSGNATEVSDYELLTPSVLFPAGSTSNQPLTVRVYGDNENESDEVVSLSLSLSGDTDAVLSPGNSTHTLTIADEDLPLVPDYEGEVLFSEAFEGGIGNWSIVKFQNHHISSPNTWYSGSNFMIGGTNTAYLTEGAANTGYNKTKSTDVALVSPLIDPLDLKDLQLSFYYAAGGEASFDYGTLLYALESAPTTFYIFDGNGSGPYLNTPDGYALLRELSLPTSLEGQRFYLAWRWVNDKASGTDPAFVIDEIKVSGQREVQSVETKLNATTDMYLGPNATINVYDNTSGRLIAQIQNNSSWDYGCTNITIDRSGSSVTEFWTAGMAYALVDKTLHINPSNNNPDGTYNISVFYTEAEIAAWEAASGKSRSLLTLAKVSGATIDQIRPDSYPAGAKGYLGGNSASQAFGELAWQVQGTFSSGFSGFGIGDPGEPPAPLPIELLYFKGTLKENAIQLHWATAMESNSDFFEIQHSTNARNFTPRGRVIATGNSNNTKEYSFIDEEAAYGTHYYRLRNEDLDGTYTYSNIIQLQQSFTRFTLKNLYPNPAKKEVRLTLFTDDVKGVQLALLDMRGIPVLQKWVATQKGFNEIVLNLRSIPPGFYLLQIHSAGQSLQEKLLVIP
jgi:hypothetical protein